jgi:hypothetical protein
MMAGFEIVLIHLRTFLTCIMCLSRSGCVFGRKFIKSLSTVGAKEEVNSAPVVKKSTAAALQSGGYAAWKTYDDSWWKMNSTSSMTETVSKTADGINVSATVMLLRVHWFMPRKRGVKQFDQADRGAVLALDYFVDNHFVYWDFVRSKDLLELVPIVLSHLQAQKIRKGVGRPGCVSRRSW